MDFLKEKFDTCVCGGGVSGIAAAIASAESGKRTLLIEQSGELGGTATAGGVSHWLGGRTPDCSSFINDGIFRRLTEQAVREGIALLPSQNKEGYSPFGWNGNPYLDAGIPFDHFRMLEMLDRAVLSSGAQILFLTRCISCEKKNGRVRAVICHNKSGTFPIRAELFIDATGDADIADMAGVPFECGDENGEFAPASLEFHVDHVDGIALKRYIDAHHSPRFLQEIKALAEKGIWKFPFDRLITVQMMEPDHFLVNTPRLTGINGLDGCSVSNLMISGRKMIFELFSIMQRYFPGFENARIRDIASMPGIRETRRIKGKYTLTVADVIEGKIFPDTIGFCCYGWDLPDPRRPSFQPMDEQHSPIHGNRIPIPFRIMEPVNVCNLLVPGRAVSVERPVLGPLRVMASCMAMGEACGRWNHVSLQ